MLRQTRQTRVSLLSAEPHLNVFAGGAQTRRFLRGMAGELQLDEPAYAYGILALLALNMYEQRRWRVSIFWKIMNSRR
jgi:hypothetical protein